MKEGDKLEVGDSLCEVSLSPSDLYLAVPVQEKGFLAKLLVPIGQSININEPIALFVSTKDEYFDLIEEDRIDSAESEKSALTSAVLNEKLRKPDAKILLRHIRHMIHDGQIKEGSGKIIYSPYQMFGC